MSTRYLEKLIDEFHKLPGIGRKSAARLAFHILDMDESDVEKFSSAMMNVKKFVKKCSVCGNFSENDLCDICSNELRDKSIICIVEDSRDIIPLEKQENITVSIMYLMEKLLLLMELLQIN